MPNHQKRRKSKQSCGSDIVFIGITSESQQKQEHSRRTLALGKVKSTL